MNRCIQWDQTALSWPIIHSKGLIWCLYSPMLGSSVDNLIKCSDNYHPTSTTPHFDSTARVYSWYWCRNYRLPAAKKLLIKLDQYQRVVWQRTRCTCNIMACSSLVCYYGVRWSRDTKLFVMNCKLLDYWNAGLLFHTDASRWLIYLFFLI